MPPEFRPDPDDSDEEPKWRPPLPPPGWRYDGAHRPRSPHRHAPRDDDPDFARMRDLLEGACEKAREFLDDETGFLERRSLRHLDGVERRMMNGIDAFHAQLIRKLEEAQARLEQFFREMRAGLGRENAAAVVATIAVDAERAAGKETPAPAEAVPESESEPKGRREEVARQTAISLKLAQMEAAERWGGYFREARVVRR